MEEEKYCFIWPSRICSGSCMAYVNEGKTTCSLLNVVSKLTPNPTRPVAPTPPPKR